MFRLPVWMFLGVSGFGGSWLFLSPSCTVLALGLAERFIRQSKWRKTTREFVGRTGISKRHLPYVYVFKPSVMYHSFEEAKEPETVEGTQFPLLLNGPEGFWHVAVLRVHFLHPFLSCVAALEPTLAAYNASSTAPPSLTKFVVEGVLCGLDVRRLTVSLLIPGQLDHVYRGSESAARHLACWGTGFATGVLRPTKCEPCR